MHFQPCFGQNFSSQDANFSFPRPLIFKENPLHRPYTFETRVAPPKSAGTHPEDQIEEENDQKLRKHARENKRMKKNEEIFFLCPPLKSLAWGLENLGIGSGKKFLRGGQKSLNSHTMIFPDPCPDSCWSTGVKVHSKRVTKLEWIYSIYTPWKSDP